MAAIGRRIVILLVALGLLASWAYVPVSFGADERPVVEVLSLRDVVKPPMASYIKRGIKQANQRNADAIVIEMDTPGGLDSSMREIIQAILDSEAPVIVYVVPGGRAASAGTFIAVAAHVAAMAPGTSIGAAHPVGSQGEDIQGTLGDKVTNDAAEYIRSLAKLRGRNSDWAADEAVRRASSLDAEGAVEQNVVDLMAPNTRALLDAVDGRVIPYHERQVTLRTANARLVETNKSLAEEFLSVISEPNVAFIMLSVAMLAIFFEFSSPGAIFPGVVGGILLLLSLYSLGTLQANWAGVLLMALAFGMFAFEIFVTSHGLLAAGGIVSFIVGALMLWGQGAPPGVEIDKRIVFSVAAAVGLFFVFVVQAVVRAHRQKPKVGAEPLLGKTAVVRTELAPSGTVLVEGELWKAVLEPPGQVQPGEQVVVVGRDGLKLRVAVIQKGGNQ